MSLRFQCSQKPRNHRFNPLLVLSGSFICSLSFKHLTAETFFGVTPTEIQNGKSYPAQHSGAWHRCQTRNSIKHLRIFIILKCIFLLPKNNTRSMPVLNEAMSLTCFVINIKVSPMRLCNVE